MTGWSTKDTDEELATRVIQLALRVPVIVADSVVTATDEEKHGSN